MMTKSTKLNKSRATKSTVLSLAVFSAFAAMANHAAFADEAKPRVYKYATTTPDTDWPSLIFEAKGKTYFKLPKALPSLEISALSSCNTQVPVQKTVIDGYVVVPGVHKTYVLSMPTRPHRVASYNGDKPLTVAELEADNAGCKTTDPKVAEKLTSAPPSAAQVTSKNSNDLAVAAKPIAATANTLPPLPFKVEAKAVLPPKPPEMYSVRVTDGTIWGSLQRWSKSAGWQLSWESTKDFTVTLEANYMGDYESAVGQLMQSLERSQYPLHACLFDNKVVRVVHKSKSCEE